MDAVQRLDVGGGERREEKIKEKKKSKLNSLKV